MAFNQKNVVVKIFIVQEDIVYFMKRFFLNESQFILLKEFLSSILYHFTDEDSIKYICTNNSIPLTHFTKYHTNDLQNDENLSKGYEYYLSFTRQRNSNIGYASWKFQNTITTVRIQFNGDALNNTFKGGPVDYFRPKSKSDSFIFVQSEDRLLSNKNEINNVYNYIDRIDILLNETDDFSMKWFKDFILDLKGTIFKDKIFAYTNKKDFNFQK